jgi:hypothetical protein
MLCYTFPHFLLPHQTAYKPERHSRDLCLTVVCCPDYSWTRVSLLWKPPPKRTSSSRTRGSHIYENHASTRTSSSRLVPYPEMRVSLLWKPHINPNVIPAQAGIPWFGNALHFFPHNVLFNSFMLPNRRYLSDYSENFILIKATHQSARHPRERGDPIFMKTTHQPERHPLDLCPILKCGSPYYENRT